MSVELAFVSKAELLARLTSEMERRHVAEQKVVWLYKKLSEAEEAVEKLTQERPVERLMPTPEHDVGTEMKLFRAHNALNAIVEARRLPDVHGHNGLCWGPWGWECFWRDHDAALAEATKAIAELGKRSLEGS